jgi:hypothetical protein
MFSNTINASGVEVVVFSLLVHQAAKSIFCTVGASGVELMLLFVSLLCKFGASGVEFDICSLVVHAPSISSCFAFVGASGVEFVNSFIFGVPPKCSAASICHVINDKT